MTCRNATALSSTRIRQLAPAKINLTLAVLGRRATDGYHELDSLVAFAADPAGQGEAVDPEPGAVADLVEMDLERPVGVRSVGPFAGSLAGENLLDVTLRIVASASPDLRLGAVTLDKRLPVAAGIGGGSADAAALIRAIMAANPGYVDKIDWHAVATRLGADVPVCLAATAQRMQGVGERLIRLPRLPRLDIVLVNPRAPVPTDKTERVFRTLAARPLDPLDARLSAPPPDISNRMRLLDHMARVGNDLQEPAIAVVPAVADVLSGLAAMPGCELAQLSGGGPTCFGVFPGPEAAQTAARQLSERHPMWWVSPAVVR